MCVRYMCKQNILEQGNIVFGHYLVIGCVKQVEQIQIERGNWRAQYLLCVKLVMSVFRCVCVCEKYMLYIYLDMLYIFGRTHKHIDTYVQDLLVVYDEI